MQMPDRDPNYIIGEECSDPGYESEPLALAFLIGIDIGRAMGTIWCDPNIGEENRREILCRLESAKQEMVKLLNPEEMEETS